MNTFIRFPDTLEQGLSLVHWERDSAPVIHPLPEQHNVKNAIALIPAHTMTFGSLPQPGIRMGRKQQLAYLQQNLPSDLLYDEPHDCLQIWHADKQHIIFTIVNQALWNHWLDLLNTPGIELVSFIPEWMLIPWDGQPGQALCTPFAAYHLVRTSQWSGYSCAIKPDDALTRILTLHNLLDDETINPGKIRSDLLHTPLPWRVRYRLKWARYWQSSKIVVCGFLVGIVTFQAGYLWQYHERYQQLPQVLNISAKNTGDIFYTRLQELQQANQLTPFVLRTMDYKHSVIQLSLSSLRPCQEINASLKVKDSHMKSSKMNTENKQTCEMMLEIAP